jgi:tetratricopeptide (TPR) repeat protein
LALSMIVRDEEANLRRLLPGIRDAFDEIVVADTGSRDGTVAFLKSIGAAVAEIAWNDDFGGARNASLAMARARWVLWLDADDELSIDDVRQLRTLLERSPHTIAYFLELYNVGSVGSQSSSCRQLRVFPNRPGVLFEGRIHEQVAHSLARQGVRFASAPITVRHHGYADPTQVRAKFERNLRLLRRERIDREDDPALVYHIAQTLVGLDLYGEAIEVLRELEGMPPRDAVVREMIVRGRLLSVRLLEAKGDEAAATACLARAHRADPDHPIVRLFVAQRRREEGDHESVIALLSTVVGEGKLTPGVLPYPVKSANEMAALFLAEAHLAQGHARPAERALDAALAVTETPAARRLHFAQRAREQGLAEVALRSYRAAAALDPRSFEARFHAGTLLLEQGALAEAHALLEEARGLRPQAPEVLVNLGNLALARGDAAGAEARYRDALAADRRFAVARENLAKLYLVTHRQNEALPVLMDLVAEDPSRWDLLAHVGDILLAQGRPGDAIAAYEQVLLAHPRAHVTWSQLGDAYLMLGAPRAAQLAWSKALEIEPSYAVAADRLTRFVAAAASIS